MKPLLFIIRGTRKIAWRIKSNYPLIPLCIFLSGLATACAPQTWTVVQVITPVPYTVDVTAPQLQSTSTARPSPEPSLKVLGNPPATSSATVTEAAEAFEMCSPLEKETIRKLFEIVTDPYKPPPENRAEERHHGVDFSHYRRKDMLTIENEAVHSILPGRVAGVVEDQLPYGNMVILETSYDRFPVEFADEIGIHPGFSLYVLYAHLAQAPEVTLQQNVACGDRMGVVGKSGYNVVNAHLHLETRSGPPEVTFGKMAFYTTAASLEEMEMYTRWRTSGEFQHMDPMGVFSAYLDWMNGLPNP